MGLINRYKVFLLVLMLGCVEPYPFQEFDTETVIVVDVSFSNEEKIHSVTLSTTYPVVESERFPLTGAQVEILEGESTSIRFLEQSSGIYLTEDSVSGTPGNEYTLRIETADGRIISSSKEILYEPGNIDSLYGRYRSFQDLETAELKSGIQFYVDVSSDLYENSFYRFEYNEIYEIRVPYPSEFKWDFENQTALRQDTIPSVCYKETQSNRLIHGSTSGLTVNRLSEFPLRFVDELDPELNYRYSMELTQFSISKGAYDYHTKIKEINESGGSFFDRQKGTVFGNLMVEDDPDQTVLGYFEVAGVSTARRVFSESEFLDQGYTSFDIHHCWQWANPQLFDIFDTVATQGLADFYSFAQNRDREIYQIQLLPFSQAILAPVGCSDCRHWNGELRKPEFWD